jgi:uncharacterized membrane protein (UPF0127 family)
MRPIANRQRRISFGLLVLAAILYGVIKPPHLWSCPLTLAETTVKIKDRKLTVEVAIAPKARGCGLSRRFHLPIDRGMLFVYNSPTPLHYWMKDTFIPLSIAFLDAAGRIISIQQMAPNQTSERYQSPKPAQYALEVNRGWFETNLIAVGDTVLFDLANVMNSP